MVRPRQETCQIHFDDLFFEYFVLSPACIKNMKGSLALRRIIIKLTVAISNYKPRLTISTVL